ncbi:MAG: GGDEF domain-containing protein [Chloroflexota bacterium]|nr:GGDEF domain-containing protein [Dehalococcoidia bacterium]MDW8252527.1 GGDEF domain-containing protein [Chloroflexota bacterium]
MFLARLEPRAASAEAARLTVLLVDLDGFKAMNDRLGHHAGDALLQAVAQRLTRCMRAEDVGARFGSDGFAILFRPVEREEAQACC